MLAQGDYPLANKNVGTPTAMNRNRINRVTPQSTSRQVVDPMTLSPSSRHSGSHCNIEEDHGHTSVLVSIPCNDNQSLSFLEAVKLEPVFQTTLSLSNNQAANGGKRGGATGKKPTQRQIGAKIVHIASHFQIRYQNLHPGDVLNEISGINVKTMSFPVIIKHITDGIQQLRTNQQQHLGEYYRGKENTPCLILSFLSGIRKEHGEERVITSRFKSQKQGTPLSTMVQQGHHIHSRVATTFRPRTSPLFGGKSRGIPVDGISRNNILKSAAAENLSGKRQVRVMTTNQRKEHVPYPTSLSISQTTPTVPQNSKTISQSSSEKYAAMKRNNFKSPRHIYQSPSILQSQAESTLNNSSILFSTEKKQHEKILHSIFSPDGDDGHCTNDFLLREDKRADQSYCSEATGQSLEHTWDGSCQTTSSPAYAVHSIPDSQFQDNVDIGVSPCLHWPDATLPCIPETAEDVCSPRLSSPSLGEEEHNDSCVQSDIKNLETIGTQISLSRNQFQGSGDKQYEVRKIQTPVATRERTEAITHSSGSHSFQSLSSSPTCSSPLVGNMSGGAETDNSRSETFGSPVSIDMLNFHYITSCTSQSDLQVIVSSLDAHDPPEYPMLLRVAKERLAKFDRQSEVPCAHHYAEKSMSGFISALSQDDWQECQDGNVLHFNDPQSVVQNQQVMASDMSHVASTVSHASCGMNLCSLSSTASINRCSALSSSNEPSFFSQVNSHTARHKCVPSEKSGTGEADSQPSFSVSPLSTKSGVDIFDDIVSHEAEEGDIDQSCDYLSTRELCEFSEQEVSVCSSSTLSAGECVLKLEADLAEALSSHSRLRAELDNAMEQKEAVQVELSSQVASMSGKLRTLESAMEMQKQSQTYQVRSLERDVREKERKLSLLKNKLVDSSLKESSIRSDLKAAVEEIGELRQRLVAETKNYSRSLKAISREKQDLENEVEQLKSQLGAKKQSIDQLRHEMEKSSSQKLKLLIESKEKEASTFISQIKLATRDVARLTRQRDEMDKVLKRLASERVETIRFAEAVTTKAALATEEAARYKQLYGDMLIDSSSNQAAAEAMANALAKSLADLDAAVEAGNQANRQLEALRDWKRRMEKKQTELDKEVALKNKELRESRDDVSDLTVRLHEERLRKQTSLDQWKRTEEGLLRKIAGLERSTECKPDLVAVEKCDILHQQLTHCQSEIRNKNLELEKQASKIKMLQEQVTRDRLKSITTPLHGKILSADTVTPEQFDKENTGAIPRVSPVLSFDAEKFSNDENDQIGVVKTSRGLQEVCNKVNSSGVQSDTMNPKKVSFAVVRPVGGRAALKEKLKRARGLVR